MPVSAWLRRRRVVVATSAAALVLAVVAVLIARGTCGTQEFEGPPLVVAAAGPMSGSSAFQGRTLLEAVRLAVDERNAAGGVRGHEVRLAVFDDRNDVEGAPELADRLADGSRAVAVVGHRSSDICVAAGRVYREKGLPAVTGGATAPEITRGNPWYFRVLFNNDQQGEFLAHYARWILGLDRMGLVVAEEASGRSLAAAFRRTAQQEGMTVVREWSFDHKSATVEARLAEVAGEVAACAECAALLIAGSEVPSRLALRALRDRGVARTVVAGQAVGRDGFNDFFRDLPQEQRRPGFYTDNVFAGSLALPDTLGAEAQAFARRYRERYGREPDTAAYGFYDAARIVLEALDRGGADGKDLAADRRRVREHLASLRGTETAFPGVTGRIFFDEERNAVKAVPIGTFSRGTLISAPVQLELVVRPEDGAGNAEQAAAGELLEIGGRPMSRVQVVYTGLDVIGIPDINLQADEFTVDLFLWFRYSGELDLENIEFANAVDPVSLGDPIWTRRRGSFDVSTFRVKATLRGGFDFHDYPFDSQVLRIELRHRTRTVGSLILALDRLGMYTRDGVGPRDKLLAGDPLGSRSWRVTDALFYQDALRSSSTLGEIGLREADSGLEYSRINAAVTIRRSLLGFGLKNVVPLLFVILILYFGYFLPYEEISTRSTIAITALLTVAVVYQQLSADLPAVGYLVTMDLGFYAAFGLALHATLACILVYIAAKKDWKRLPRWVDLSGMILTPLLLLVLGILVVVYYGHVF